MEPNSPLDLSRPSTTFGNISTATVIWSDVQGGFAGTGNINSDPKLTRNPSKGPDNTWGTADDDYGDLRLQSVSPCIDAGSDAAVPAGVTTDLAGNPRFVDIPFVHDGGQTVDIGAYEYLPTFATTSFTFNYTPAQLTITHTFTLDPQVSSLAASDLIIRALVDPKSGQVPMAVPADSVSFDPATHIVRWTFNSAGLVDADYAVVLYAGVLNASTGTPLPADNIYHFFLLTGDANADRVVNSLDFTILAANFGQQVSGYDQADFNGDGIVNSLDFNALASKFGSYLPPMELEGQAIGSSEPLPLALSASQPASLFRTHRIDSADSLDLSKII